jgi:hypothetical protein
MRDRAATRLTASLLLTTMAVIIAVTPRIASAEIYKCKGSDGRVVYSDAPCAAQTQQETVRIYDSPSAPAVPAPRPATAAMPGGAAGNAPPTDCRNWGPGPRVRVDLPPPAPDYSAYPKDAQGRPILSQGANVNWVQSDKRDLLSVISACSAMITQCFHRDGDIHNSLDACFNSAPRCRTAKPWEEDTPCCPDACWQRYAEQRRQCVDPLTASSRVFFDQHCSPAPAAASKR